LERFVSQLVVVSAADFQYGFGERFPVSFFKGMPFTQSAPTDENRFQPMDVWTSREGDSGADNSTRRHLLDEVIAVRAPSPLSKSSLGDAKSSMGDATSSLGDATSSLGDAKSSLGDAKSSLGDTESSLGGAKSSLG
jgi:hypothetical protein